MTFYYSSLNNLIQHKQCCKFYAYIFNGYSLKNISEYPLNNFIFLRLYHIKKFNKDEYIGSIDYEILVNTIIIHNLSIDNKFQKNGIGSTLIKIAEINAISNNIPNMTLYINQNMRNLIFYKKLGYDINYNNNNYIRWNKNPNYIQMIKYLNI
jgi:ribosomal protein S18 acetylase RimI-like enzyme